MVLNDRCSRFLIPSSIEFLSLISNFCSHLDNLQHRHRAIEGEKKKEKKKFKVEKFDSRLFHRFYEDLINRYRLLTNSSGFETKPVKL